MPMNVHMPLLTRRRVLRIGAWACLVLLAILSLMPGSVQMRTGMSGSLEHVLAYFGTATMFVLGYRTKKYLILTGLVAYGGLLEVLQGFSPGRMPSLADAAASGAGAALGVALWGAILYRRQRPSILKRA